MKIQIVSDLHLEFTNRRHPMEIENVGSDVLILAGDICTANHFDHFLPFFKGVSEKFSQVLYVVGNHEHYKYKFQETILTIKQHLKQFENIQVLDKEWFIIGDVLFWGATLWTNCNNKNKETRHILASRMNDFRLIQYGEWDHMLPVNIENEFQESVFSLKYTLEEINYTRFVNTLHCGKVVVITHHAPSFQSVSSKYKTDFHRNGGYASDLESWVLTYPEIKLWCHGHMHSSSDYMIGETRVIANPAGYPDWHGTENSHFNKELVIEI